MNITYDHIGDAMSINLTDNQRVYTQTLNDSIYLHMDEFDQLVSIEILGVRTLGIDPLTLITMHYTPTHGVTLPTPEEKEAKSKEITAARKRWKARKTAEKTTNPE